MNIGTYINEAVIELRHVRWPTRQQAIRLSIITIGFTTAVAISFGGIDYALNQVVKVLLSLTY
ncbi:MAG: preprotein translocase subunit SecE [Candidatus Peribacter sp.]|jgi:preprotein translocase SecE subunit|nr:preprotein translocase subunit SecE [Candidatus Peribacter sp.]MBT4392801.1 preprotein translocase subunit SecE [Candidatus Peribacter sp.]MBT4600582.1 preprotein translocase subunit SecE [Candidatus Peribacter sp.]MBT5148749.1 preprotein translocase subunit SecE [Candidatus Peribacter sp.]MBT5637656.1 preprotein translocase subunit SecE [Candidatus Peribacter sp.]